MTSDSNNIPFKIARIHGGILAFVFAFLGGLGLFIATAWLILQDGDNPGTHLQLLSNYFPGYAVTWKGSFLGAVYGACSGGIVGWMIGFIYNFFVNLRHGHKGCRKVLISE